jgi:hypothetical protein
MNKLMTIPILFLISCGSGGGNSEPLNCPVEGYPLYCSAYNYCCPPELPYLCDLRSTYFPDPVCSRNPCPANSTVLDYCGEE